MPEDQSKPLSLSILLIPQYKYFPAHLMERRGPKQWARLRILQACERLGIPEMLWPKFPDFHLARPYALKLRIKDRPEIPAFEPLIETVAQWKERCLEAFDKALEEHARKARAYFRSEVERGIYVKIKPTHDTTPLDLRYEWAAHRLCYRTPFPEIAKAEATRGYSEERIKQVVSRIIREAGLRQAI